MGGGGVFAVSSQKIKNKVTRGSAWPGTVRGMKKVLLAAMGLSGVLASCGGSVVVGVGGGYYGDGQSTNLQLNSLTNYRTSWQLSSNVQDQSGRTLTAGTYIICDNTNTDISVDLTWTGGLSKLGLQLRGVNSDTYRNISVYPYSVVDTSGSGTATYSLGAAMAPLATKSSLSAQAIVVNPITAVDIKGYTYVRAQGLDAFGLASNVLTSGYSIPVVDCQ